MENCIVNRMDITYVLHWQHKLDVTKPGFPLVSQIVRARLPGLLQLRNYQGVDPKKKWGGTCWGKVWSLEALCGFLLKDLKSLLSDLHSQNSLSVHF